MSEMMGPLFPINFGAKWRHTIDVSSEWRKAEEDPEGFRAVARSAAQQLRDLPTADSPSAELITDLEDVADDDGCDADDFDAIWASLYDWADVGKRLWIDIRGTA